jgi:RNA polymerase sigma-70 factor (ECF subfamily)
MRVQEQNQLGRFEQVVLAHLDAAYNLARWLTRNDQDAEDVVQEACLRAYKFFPGFRGGNSRTWLLTIVRNTCYTWLRQNRSHELSAAFDEELHQVEADCASLNPEVMFERSANVQLLKDVLAELPMEFREVMVLRELEELSYKEIARIAGVPIGTVMSRLARARQRLQTCLTRHADGEELE